MKLQLVGEDYTARSIAAQQMSCVNFYPELLEGVTARGAVAPGAQSKSAGALYNTPGRVLFAALTGPIRAELSVNGRFWVVANTNLVELDHTGATITSHALPSSTGTGPASIAFNGTQVLVVDSNNIVSFDAGSSCIACTFAGSAGNVTSVPLTGQCDTFFAGAAVVGYGANDFGLGPLLVGKAITIGATTYTITGWVSPTTVTVTPNPGNQTAAHFVLGPTQVNWVSGDQFVTGSSWTGRTITINGTAYTIFAVFSSTVLYTTTLINPTVTNVAYSVIGDAVTGAGPIAYLDGYFIIRRPAGGTPDLHRQFNVSALNDGSSWDQLSFGIKESYPDDLVSVLAANEQLYLFGSESLEVWQNTGGTTTNPFPFSRIPGSVSRFGAVSPWGQLALDGNVYFLGGDGSGNIRAYVLNGWSPVPISTPAQENTWTANTPGAFGFSQGAIAYGYLEEGHSFAVWTNRNYGVGQTHVYDQSTGCWHQRYTWGGAAWAFNQVEFHAFAFNQAGNWGEGYHLVADQTSGNIYVSDINYFTDAAAGSGAIKCVRYLPYIYEGNQRLIYGRFTLEMETGGIPSGAAPSIQLSWSDDRGQTFRGNLSASLGTAGQTSQRVYWTRTGGLSGDGGMSRGRIFAITVLIPPATPYKVALIDAEVDVAVCG